MSRFRRRPRGPVIVLGVVVATAVALLVTAGLQDTIRYYRTPSEVAQSSASVGQSVRLGGRVVPGTVRHDGPVTEFTLGDGDSTLVVLAPGALPDTFREGQDAVVEGILQPDGTFRADTVAVKHSNEYRAATPASGRTPP